MKVWNMERLNHQIQLAMVRFVKTSGHFVIGDRYEVDGTIRLILR